MHPQSRYKEAQPTGTEAKNEMLRADDLRAAADIDEAVSYVSSSMVTEPPKIALTFDDGPSNVCTERLLDGLKERGVKATFFLIGQNAEKYPDIVRRIDEEGHLLGNHTYHHVEITKVSDEEAIYEIEQTEMCIRDRIMFPMRNGQSTCMSC